MKIYLQDTLNLNKKFIRMIILSQLILSVSTQTLVYSNFFGDFSYSNDWYIYGGNGGEYQLCGSTKIFGGSPLFYRETHIIKTFNLQPHYQIRFSFKLWHLDNWGGEQLIVYVDNVLAHSQSYSSEYSRPSICGIQSSAYGDGIDDVSEVMLHSSSTLQIIINGQENYWGISEFQLMIDKCPTGCELCNSSSCLLLKLYIKKLNPINLDSSYGWIYDNLNENTYQTCLDQNYLKSSSNQLTNAIQLPSHDRVAIRIKVMTFNSDPHFVQIYIDDILVQTSNQSKQVYTKKVICDVMTLSSIQILDYIHSHSTLKIQVIATMNSKYYCDSTIYSNCQQILGINDFELFIHRSIQFEHICTDFNINPFDGCFSNIYDCVVGCKNCINGICIKCNNGWEYQQSIKKCVPICGDSIITHLEECDDGNMIPYDGCYRCKFSCQKFCGICKFGKCLQCQTEYKMIQNECRFMNNYYESSENIENFEFNNQITNFISKGFYQHALLKDEFTIHRKIKQLDCNVQSYGIFGYYYNQCSIETISNCKLQLFDKCLKCQPFYYLQSNEKECHPICGDGKTVFNEICDDQNNFQFDNCYKCELSCQFECKQCNQHECLECIDGWSLIDRRCHQICGDGIVALNTFEQCDDGNYEPNDGCYECKFECDQNCFFCTGFGVCMSCIENFQLINQSHCIPICGDGIIIEGLEECEDQNDTKYDGCYQCQFQCEINCTKCFQGICQDCIDGYELTLNGCSKIIIIYEDDTDIVDQSFVIKNLCGNGQLQDNEQCDDQNQENFDGCSNNCEIENNWICNQDEPSRCFQMTLLLLSYLNQTYDNQYVQLSFSNPVKLKIPSQIFQKTIITQINSLKQDQYNITIYPVINFDEAQFTAVKFELKITIFQSIQIIPNLSVTFNTSVIDQNNLLVEQSPTILILQQPQVLDSSQINAANQFQEFGNKMMMGLGIISLLMLLLGKPNLSLEIFDTLQFQSYLKFVNVQYPQNLKIYFQSSEFVTINPVLTNFKIAGFLDSTIGANYIQSYGKLSEYEVNADLFTNIKGQIVQISIILFLFVFAKLYHKVFVNYCFTSRYFYCIRSTNSKCFEFFALKYYYMNKKLIGIKNIFKMRGFRQLFYANSWDLLFKVILFLTSNHQTGYRIVLSYLFCIFCLILVFYFLSMHFQRQQGKIILSNVRNDQHEGIILFKKLLFIVILIALQNTDTFQCLMLTILTFSYIGLILSIKFVNQKLDLIITIWMEAPVMLFTISSIFHCFDFQQRLSLDQQVLLGFGQIGILLLGLFGPILRFNYLLYKQIRTYFQLRKNKQQIKIINQSNLFAVVDI
ncbi:unnamed protein product [Paramecium sonneborni]|uniref:Uncharacterized protein n=1 Tax=Paramecium sonneborni TaxID=65129 RepID=A0A8S1P3L8_9CILI|nr:unnamed protein product [Paramecium sonneborni]